MDGRDYALYSIATGDDNSTGSSGDAGGSGECGFITMFVTILILYGIVKLIAGF